ncbi:MAG: hypothetical protein J5I28_02230 [Acidimicrobiales bacterium]|nr:hypothetical protein [Acidimicrobiales bacterium]
MTGLADRGALRPLTLRFVDDDLERAYQYDEGAKGLSGYRIITGATLVLWAVAALILPIGTDIDPGLARTVCGLMALAGALCLFLSKWAPTMDRQHALATALTSANGLVILLISDAAGIIEGYAVGAILLVFVFGFVSRTRFIHATVRTVIIGLGVAAAVVLYDGEGSLIVDLFVYIAAGLGSIVGLRMIERNRRQEWHQRHVIEEQAVALAMARAESERLLLNILPESVSRRLKSGESPIADTFSDASVLFADIVDFTPLATSLTAAEVIALLSGLYSRFDDLVAEHGLEKIKTIGDCYLAVGGLPDPLEDHATRVIGLARAMVTATSPKVHSPICVSGSESTPDRWPEALSGPGASPTTFGATRSIPPLASRRRATRGESMSAKPLGHSRITTSGTSRGGG